MLDAHTDSRHRAVSTAARRNRRLAAAWLLVVASCAAPLSPAARHPERVALDPRQPAGTARAPEDAGALTAFTEARGVLESRCVHCHGCYDAPCQLKLDEPGGAIRGGSKLPVYDGARLTAAVPTRYGIDAQSVDEWRGLGFHDVLSGTGGQPSSDSVLLKMLALKRAHPLPAGQALPPDLSVGIDHDAQCPNADEMDTYGREHPNWGMPYALPALTDTEQATLERWIAAGSPIAPPAAPAPEAQSAVAHWERFLNQPGNKPQLMSRYLFEHLFVATLQLAANDGGTTDYRLVRSVTPPGQPLEEMATRRPFTPPIGTAGPYYRLRRRTGARLSKTHMPYALNDARMARWRALFLEPDYEVPALPGYAPEHAANPFATFAAIPVRSRYAFLLDEAEFTVMGFIKGPVCRGQVALDVIQDHFWITFVSPDAPLVAAEDDFLRRTAPLLDLPAGDGSNALPTRWFHYANHERKYLTAKSRFLAQQSARAAPTLAAIWDGDGDNPNAGLTVFRHFDSASVAKGLLGPPPKTAWVLGYSVLERIHYLLVAGFDVFGNVAHQLDTRMYMDFLRMEAEHNFLLLLPKRLRRGLVDDWYQGVDGDVRDEVYGRIASFKGETGIAYRSVDPKRELLRALQQHLAAAHTNTGHALSQLDDPTLRAQLKALQAIGGMAASHFPEHAFMSLRGDDGQHQHFTLLRTSAHTNVAHLFREHARRSPEHDRLVVLPGFVGAYPNAFFTADVAALGAFVEAAAAIDDRAGYRRLHGRYGVGRTDARFWAHSDMLRGARHTLPGAEAGLLDYNRLE